MENELIIKRENERLKVEGLITRYKNRHAKYNKNTDEDTDINEDIYKYENEIKYKKHIEEMENELIIKRENERLKVEGLITRYKNRHSQYDKK